MFNMAHSKSNTAHCETSTLCVYIQWPGRWKALIDKHCNRTQQLHFKSRLLLIQGLQESDGRPCHYTVIPDTHLIYRAQWDRHCYAWLSNIWKYWHDKGSIVATGTLLRATKLAFNQILCPFVVVSLTTTKLHSKVWPKCCLIQCHYHRRSEWNRPFPASQQTSTAENVPSLYSHLESR